MEQQEIEYFSLMSVWQHSTSLIIKTRSKQDDKCEKLLFELYAKNSKVYKFCYPQNERSIISRDAKFTEEGFWWQKVSQNKNYNFFPCLMSLQLLIYHQVRQLLLLHHKCLLMLLMQIKKICLLLTPLKGHLVCDVWLNYKKRKKKLMIPPYSVYLQIQNQCPLRKLSRKNNT